MKSVKLYPVVVVFLLSGLKSGCSDNDTGIDTDGGPSKTDAKKDGFQLPDGYQLHECKIPGLSCNAHDFCAIDPICGDDFKCYPSGLQNCDDGLDCTNDICLGSGECKHEPKMFWCALPVKKEATETEPSKTEIVCIENTKSHPNDPCKVCINDEEDLEKNKPTEWTKANGGTCDDDDPCTKDDYCQSGVCKGTDYREDCADEYGCTEEVCDGMGGCGQPKLRADSCLINGDCYAKDQRDETGCYACDPATSQSQWVSITDKCTIDGYCYKRGEPDKTGCGACDPDKDPKGWTLLTGVCKIGDKCYQKNDPHPQGCAACDPTVSITDWTVASDKCLVKGSSTIYDDCYDKDAPSSNGCSSCQPSVSQTQLTPLPNQCEIDTKCWPKNATDATGCGVCDPDISATSWSVKVNKCLIEDVCYDPDALEPETQCSKCDTAASKTSWTALTGKCFIGQKCWDNLGLNSAGCLLCDIAQDPKGWSAPPNVNLTSYTFDDGINPPDGWTITNTTGTTVGWVVTDKRPWSGTHSLYYGDPATGNYNSGGINKGTAVTPPIALTAGKKAGLSFLVWMETESSDSWDKLEVSVGTTVLWRKDSTTYPDMKKWQEVHVDLSQFQGQTISIQFLFDTDDPTFNDTEGTYLDNIVIYENC